MPHTPGIYRRFVPAGSRRDRVLWSGWLAVRKMQDGPGPWARAVSQGLFRALPARVQRGILRARGKLPVDRSDGRPTAAGACPGLEVPERVSIVLPVYRQAELLGDAIDSALAQRDVDFELIVIDDGSGDDVAEVIASRADHPRLRWLRQDNRGLPQALSAAFRLTSGTYSCWTSADNLMEPLQLRTLVDALQERPEVGMVYADYALIDETGAELSGSEFRIGERAAPGSAVVVVPRDPERLAAVQDNFVGPCFVYRSAAGRLLGDYEPEMGLEDYDYWLRLRRHFGLTHLGDDAVLYRYRVHEDSLTARARELKIAERGAALILRERERAAFDPAFDVVDAATLDIEAHRARLQADPLHCVAVRCENVASTYAAGSLLQHPRVAAFAATPQCFARAALFTRDVWPATDTEELMPWARRFANERAWQSREWPSNNRVAPRAVWRLPAERVPLRRSPPRVLFQADQCTAGGLENVLHDLTQHLLAEGADRVGLLTLGATGPAVERMRAAGVEIFALQQSAPPEAYDALLETGGWDLVHAHDSVAFADRAAAQGIPFVQTVHNCYVWFDEARRRAYRDADASTAAYVAVSNGALEYADRRIGIDVDKAVLIPNGIDVAAVDPKPNPDARSAQRRALGIADDAVVFLQVAAIAPQKAQRSTVRALHALRNRGIPAELILLGDATDSWYANALQRDVDSQQLSAYVHVLGRKPRAQFDACADVFVLPSIYEGCSLAVLESIAAGLPLVLTDVGAAREQLALGSGVLVTPHQGPIAQLDSTTLGPALADAPAAHIEELAEAMAQAAALPRRTPTLQQFHSIDRAEPLARHLQLCAWLLQGGAASAARDWLRQRFVEDDTGPRDDSAGR